jgi:hypothetical protein
MTSSFQSTTSGGGWGGPIAAIFTAMIAAVLLGPLLHWLEIALACLGIGAVITAGLMLRRRLREHKAMTQGRYVPWLQPPQQQQQQRQQFPGAQQPPAVQDGGQHLHLHLGGLSAAERAELMRQLRGDR